MTFSAQPKVAAPKATDAKGRTVLITLFEQTHFREMRRLISTLNDGGLRPVVHFGHPYPFHQADMIEAHALSPAEMYVAGRKAFPTGDSGPAVGSAEPPPPVDMAYRNALINGDFNVWSRGTTFEGDCYKYGTDFDTADRWRLRTPGPNGVVRVTRGDMSPQQTGPAAGSKHFLRWEQVQAHEGEARLQQRIEGVLTFAGEQVALSFLARANAVVAMDVGFEFSYGIGGTSRIVSQRIYVQPQWQRFCLIFTFPHPGEEGICPDDHINLRFLFPAAATFSIDLAQVQVEEGDRPTAFEQRELDYETALCRAPVYPVPMGQADEAYVDRLVSHHIERAKRRFVQIFKHRTGSDLLEERWQRRVGRLHMPLRGIIPAIGDLRRLRRMVENLLDSVQPDLLVFCEDNVEYRTTVYIKAAKRRGIRTLILPYTVASATEPAQMLKDVPALNVTGIRRALIKALWPQWLYSHEDRLLSRCSPGVVIAMELLGYAPPKPWVYHSAADVIAVENQAMARHYAKEGLHPDRLVEVGALYDDVLAAQAADASRRRKRLYRELGLPSDKPLLLCAFPQDAFWRRGPYSDFDSFGDLVSFLGDLLASQDRFNVIIRPHPTTVAASIAGLTERGLRVVQHDTAKLVPLCDLYLASISATIRWAIACGKPVINFDCYRLRYADYDEAGGTTRVEGRNEFQQLFDQLLAEPALLEGMAARQRACQADWGRLDQCSGKRIQALISQLAAR